MNIPVISAVDRWVLAQMERPRLAGVDFELAFRRSMRIFTLSLMLLVAGIAYTGYTPRPPAPPGGTALAVKDYGDDLNLEKTAVIQSIPVDTSTQPPAGPRPPGRLIITKISVDAPVVAVGTDSNGNMAVTNHSWDTGWYDRGPSPGDAGDAVITGHLDWYDTSQAVFFNLHRLAPGDEITVQRLDGVTHRFRVTSVQTVPYNAHPAGLFATSGPPRLSLITCGGTWDRKLGQYTSRVVVDSELID